MNSYRKCSLCPKNVGHYCDECEIRINRVLYEASKLHVDYEHLNEINTVLMKRITEHPEEYSLNFLNKEKLELEMIRLRIRKMRENIVRNKNLIKNIETDLLESGLNASTIDLHIMKIYDEINKIRTLNDVCTVLESNIDLVGINLIGIESVNINTSEYV